MIIGLISDTHGMPLPPDLAAVFRGAERILHAGDIGSLAILDALAAIAPVDAVFGNVDPPEVVSQLSGRRLIVVDGVRIGLTHGHRGVGQTTPDRALERFTADAVDVVVFGHSHEPLVELRGSILLVNPGSAAQPRNQPYPTVALLYTGRPPRAEIIPVDRPQRG